MRLNSDNPHQTLYVFFYYEDQRFLIIFVGEVERIKQKKFAINDFIFITDEGEVGFFSKLY